MRLFFCLLFVLLFIHANGQPSNARVFMDAFNLHRGNYYEGMIVAGGKEGDGFTGKRLLMHVMECGERQVKVPFFVGDDRSRTWIFTFSNNRVELKHDHRHIDGSPDSVTFYGGTANNEGWTDMQLFPADAETCELIDYGCHNVWWVTIDDEKFTYNLRRIGTDRFFSVSFDLTKPVETDLTPW